MQAEAKSAVAVLRDGLKAADVSLSHKRFEVSLDAVPILAGDEGHLGLESRAFPGYVVDLDLYRRRGRWYVRSIERGREQK